jgi:hypothetical protein
MIVRLDANRVDGVNEQGAPTVMATYRVKPEREADMVHLLHRHWPTLRAHGLVTDEPPTVYRGVDGAGGPYYLEIFSWRELECARAAHTNPAVMEIWGPMEECCEARDGRPAMEFPGLERVQLRVE